MNILMFYETKHPPESNTKSLYRNICLDHVMDVYQKQIPFLFFVTIQILSEHLIKPWLDIIHTVEHKRLEDFVKSRITILSIQLN